MESHWLNCSLNSPTKVVLFKTLFLESLTVTLAITAAVWLGKSPELHFREEGFITYVSCLQLSIASFIAGNIFYQIWQSKNAQLIKNAMFWAIISLGLLFLIADEAYEIHEHLDFWLHDLFNLEETAITDLADDLIVGSYLVIFLLYAFTQWQTLKIFRRAWGFFKIGFILVGAMVFLDMASNNTLFVSLIFADDDRALLLKQWLGAVEDSVKIFAEGMIIIGIYRCRKISQAIIEGRTSDIEH